MIFIRYENFRQYVSRYPVTTSILAINIVLFVLMTVVGSSRDPNTLIRFGALYRLFEGDVPALWRFIAAIFVHIGAEHLLFNCFAIFVFAPPLEHLLGRWSYLVYYLGSGVAGNVLSEWVQTGQHISAGASGSIYGIFAAFLYLILFRKSMLDPQSQKTVITILIIGIVFSLITPQVNIWAHAGGGIGGFISFRFLFKQREKRRRSIQNNSDGVR